jgi:SAM-dependent methyltransferase
LRQADCDGDVLIPAMFLLTMSQATTCMERRLLRFKTGANTLSLYDLMDCAYWRTPSRRNPLQRLKRSQRLSDDYEYRGLMAQAWDLLRGDTSTWPDRPFYRTIIELGCGPALDVGCGTGRLLLDYLEAGLDVDGVDNSPEMLRICRDKATAMGIDISPRLFEQAMDKLALSRRYATIFVPSSSFQLLTDARAAGEAMKRFHKHLRPGGVLVMSVMSKLWRGKTLPPHMVWSDWHKLGERQRSDGVTIRRWTRARYDHAEQLEHEESRYEVLSNGIVVETEAHARSPAVRWYSQSQAAALYEKAGFANVRALSGFTFEPATREDTTFCMLGTR